MRGQKRVSGNQPVFTAIKCICKSFKAFLRSETIDIGFFALSFYFNQWNSSPFILLVSKLSVWGSREMVTKQQHAHSVENLRWRWSTSNLKMKCKPEFNPPYWVSKSPWFPLSWPPRNSLSHNLYFSLEVAERHTGFIDREHKGWGLRARFARVLATYFTFTYFTLAKSIINIVES